MAASSMVEPDLPFLPAPSRVRLVSAQDVAAVSADLRSKVEHSDGQYRLVSIAYDRLPAIKSLIEDALERLADAALSLYPYWYGGAIPFARFEGSPFAFEALIAEQLSHSDQLRRAVSLPWLKAARRLCRLGKAPIPREFPAAAQVAQLAPRDRPRPPPHRPVPRRRATRDGRAPGAREGGGMARARDRCPGPRRRTGAAGRLVGVG